MENYAAYNYPDSGNSSPRSREIDFDNSWEEPSLSTSSTGSINNLKAKFMVSYGGKIQPRPHDNQLSYVGGETKILAVDRSIRFSSLIAKLSSLFPEAGACGDVSFKYQLPGEDLDALISVTNDDDLDHLIHEYDRLNRSSSKPARLRLFLFSAAQPHAPPPSLHHSRDQAAQPHHHHTAGQFGSGDSVKSDRERMFVDALNSAAPPPPPTAVPVPPPVAAATVTNNVDYLFGLEKGIGVGVPAAQMHAVSPPPPSHHLPKLHDPIPDPDYGMPDPQIEARIQELNRLQLSANQQQQLQQQLQQQFHQQQQVQHHQLQQQQQQQQQMLYQAAAKSEENLVNVAVDPGYGQRYPDKFHQHQPQQTFPAGYWPPDQKNMVSSGGYQPTIGVEQQPVYMIPATGAVYHNPVMRPVPQGMSAPPPPQQHQQQQHQQQQPGYYPVQRVQAGEVYRDMPVYGVVSTAPTVPSTVSPQVQKMASGVTGGGYGGEGVGMQQMRQVPGGEMGGYAQVAYDSATGRQVYYAAPPSGVGSGGGSTGGGSVPVATPYQVAAAAGGPAPAPPAAAVVSNTSVINGGGEGRTSGGGESVGGGGKAVPKVSPNSGTV